MMGWTQRTGTAVAVIEREELPQCALSEEAMDSLRALVAQSMSEETRRAYLGDWARFEQWCEDRGHVALPADPMVIASYCDWRGLTKKDKYAYIMRSLSAIRCFHEKSGMGNPVRSAPVQAATRGLRRSIGVQQKRAAPMVVERIRQCLRHVGYSRSTSGEPGVMRAARDRAMLLVGFLGALRRSELCALTVEDLHFCDEGVVLHLRRSKTDQDGAGQAIPIPYAVREPDLCAVTALKAWMDLAGVTSGPLWRNLYGERVSEEKGMCTQTWFLAIKNIAQRAGLVQPGLVFSTHSLRAGVITEAYRRRVAEATVMRGSRHTSQQTMHRYIREARMWTDNLVTEMRL